jgi:predicted nucleic-acid-binding protein
VIALATNVWARAILGDDPRQSRAAREVIEQNASGTGVFMPILAFVELGWVLGSAPGWTPARVHQALDRLLNTEGVEVESASLARAALAACTGAVGLADHLIALAARGRGCSRLLTFDTRFARTGKAELLKA